MFTNLLQNKNVQKTAGIALVIVALVLALWYIRNDLSTKTERGSVIQEGGIGADIREGEGAIEQIPTDTTIRIPEQIPAPNLERPLIFPAGFDKTAEDIIRNNVTQLVSTLTENPDSFGAWLDLATQYKIIGDYKGAAEIWEYLNKVTEGNTISRVNLGSLYHYELKEYEKSEANFKDALRINNQIPEAYTGLLELYRYSYRTNTPEAESILKEGIAALPKNIDLVMTLAGYYKDRERTEDAKDTYQKARALAEAVGNKTLVNAIDAELSAL